MLPLTKVHSYLNATLVKGFTFWEFWVAKKETFLCDKIQLRKER